MGRDAVLCAPARRELACAAARTPAAPPPLLPAFSSRAVDSGVARRAWRKQIEAEEQKMDPDLRDSTQNILDWVSGCLALPPGAPLVERCGLTVRARARTRVASWTRSSESAKRESGRIFG